MGFLIFLFLLSPPDLCKTMLSDGTLAMRPCVHVTIPPPKDMPELEVKCRGGLNDRSLEHVAMTGYCPQETIA